MAKSSKRSTSQAATSDLLQKILKLSRSGKFTAYIRDLLVELCRVDTTPSPVVERMRRAEDRCFKVLERELGSMGFNGLQLERRAINPKISKHANYSLLHFTKTIRRPEGLSPEETYANRSNLVCLIPGEQKHPRGVSTAVNAHIDVVAPYLLPSVKGGTVFGRGSCDDKGPLVGIVAALKLLSRVLPMARLSFNKNVVGMFVIEEETGGNGSLSLAIDRNLRKLYDSIVVCECTGLKLHPANRGAVWYRTLLTPPARVCPIELFAFVNEEIEKEGRAIRAESYHSLFPQRPVQTCHGIIGPFGEHPSRICGRVEFHVGFPRGAAARAEQLVSDCLAAGLEGYLGLYGDKSRIMEAATGKPMVPVHYELRRKGDVFLVTVHGATGHMGAIRERDGAITKMAHLVRSLVFSRKRIETEANGVFRFSLPKHAAKTLVLEGGQGFVPTHSINEVMDRLRTAAERGAEVCLRRLGRLQAGRDVVSMTYEKLHNVAFDGNPNSVSMRHALRAAAACGLPEQQPVLGWTVSCDSRLFATEYPGMEVLTFGPGQLAFAHSDTEQIELEEIRKAAEFLSYYLLLQTGTVPR